MLVGRWGRGWRRRTVEVAEPVDGEEGDAPAEEGDDAGPGFWDF